MRAWIPLLVVALGLGWAAELRPVATVAGPLVRLGDVAELAPEEAPAAGVVLAAAPSVGLERRLTLAYVAGELARAGFGEVTLGGSPAVAVRRASQAVTGAQLAQAAVDAVIRRMPWDPERVAIDLSSRLPDLSVPAGEIELVGVVPEGSRFAGNETVLVSVRVGGEEVKKVAVPLCIRVREEVLVARRYISRRSRLSAEDFLVEERDIAEIAGEPVPASEGVEGLMSTGVIRPGEVLLRSDVAPAPVVSRGDVVTVLVETPALRVSALAEVRESGAPGDLVLVRNPVSKKEFYAEVVDSRTLRVPLGGR